MKATERHCPGRLRSVLLGDLQLLPECGPRAPTLSSPAGVPANLHCSVIPSFGEVSILEDLRPQQPPNSTRQKDLQCLHGPSPSPTSTSSTSVPHGERGGLREVAAAPTPDGGLCQGGLNHTAGDGGSRAQKQHRAPSTAITHSTSWGRGSCSTAKAWACCSGRLYFGWARGTGQGLPVSPWGGEAEDLNWAPASAAHPA